MRQRLRAQCLNAGGVSAYARIHNLSRNTIFEILGKRRAVTPQVANVMGFDRIHVYVQRDPS